MPAIHFPHEVPVMRHSPSVVPCRVRLGGGLNLGTVADALSGLPQLSAGLPQEWLACEPWPLKPPPASPHTAPQPEHPTYTDPPGMPDPATASHDHASQSSSQTASSPPGTSDPVTTSCQQASQSSPDPAMTSPEQPAVTAPGRSSHGPPDTQISGTGNLDTAACDVVARAPAPEPPYPPPGNATLPDQVHTDPSTSGAIPGPALQETRTDGALPSQEHSDPRGSGPMASQPLGKPGTPGTATLPDQDQGDPGSTLAAPGHPLMETARNGALPDQERSAPGATGMNSGQAVGTAGTAGIVVLPNQEGGDPECSGASAGRGTSKLDGSGTPPREKPAEDGQHGADSHHACVEDVSGRQSAPEASTGREASAAASSLAAQDGELASPPELEQVKSPSLP
jgi:hypothetical protein